MSDVRVNLGEREYDISITTDDWRGLGPLARGRCHGSLACIITDEHVERYAPAVRESLAAIGFRNTIAVLRAGEGQKSLACASDLYDDLVQFGADRETLIVALGGGVIGDLAGFVAATYARGLPLLMVPTTLLAMVDSSVGGKVAVNHPKAKNLIGTFHQPVGVWINVKTLETLPDREYRSGLAEVVKYGVSLDGALFNSLEEKADQLLQREPVIIQTIVKQCCRLKANIVEKDERERTGLRMLLNYGHTFAHAFEAVQGYGHWLHGEAVSLGMMCAARYAERAGFLSDEVGLRQEKLLRRFGLPTSLPPLPSGDVLQAMRRDKKAKGGQLRLMLPRAVGEAFLMEEADETENLIAAVLDELTATPDKAHN
jgi:3-dehydroquinate synthase